MDQNGVKITSKSHIFTGENLELNPLDRINGTPFLTADILTGGRLDQSLNHVISLGHVQRAILQHENQVLPAPK